MTRKKNPNYPLKHLSIRVPWHDLAWNGHICNNPKGNGACLILKNCALNRDDDKEMRHRGESIETLQEENFPTCVRERGTFMAPFEFTRTLSHPYAKSSPDTHGHLKPTKVHYRPYTTDSVPYAWMTKEGAKEKTKLYDLDFDMDREPTLGWNDNWVQEYSNQKALLDCFYEHIEPETSLVFFYAKQVPFVEESGRVLIGVGRVKSIKESGKYEGSNSKLSCAYWEQMITHSIRPNPKNLDGFLLPYHEAIKYTEKDSDFDPAEIAVLAPADKRMEFSYVSEHVSNDTSIRVLMECVKKIERLEELSIGSRHQDMITWIHAEVHRLQKLRGDYPGMGAALCALGIPRGHFVAAAIINSIDEKENPWKVFELAIDDPETHLPIELHTAIPDSVKRVYKTAYQLKENKHRLQLLQLLSRFDISQEQAKLIFTEEELEKLAPELKGGDFLDNPWLLYEATRHVLGGGPKKLPPPINLATVDLGLYLPKSKDHLLPQGFVYNDPLDERRIRALTIQRLENAALQGHTLLSRKQLINQIRDLAIEPKCEVNRDFFIQAEPAFTGAIEKVKMQDEEPAYQLSRLAKVGSIIRAKVKNRVNSKRFDLDISWRNLVDQELQKHTEGDPDEKEVKAREEKAAAVKELAESRVSVLIGPAGTGKTTLLKILAGQEEIAKEGVLLLAPTGKARVRMEEVAQELDVPAFTIAQFLSRYDRYDGENQRYILSDKKCESRYGTVILDEASMLTEEMLATLVDSFKKVNRFVLVGDHRQLPPIGAGRPFYDIIKFLEPESFEGGFPRIGKGYAELTIKRRQGGSGREDLQLADWFSGGELEPAADGLINDLLAGKKSNYLRVAGWKNEEDFERLFEDVLQEELELESLGDVIGFNLSLGAVNGQWFNFRGDTEKVEAWQILSPIREKPFGVKAINRKIHKLFRQKLVDRCHDRFHSTFPKPFGTEEIVYGDKVINLSNQSRHPKTVYPSEGINYIANGEIGIVNGQMKKKSDRKKYKGRPKNLNVEFTSQPEYNYSFKSKEFGEEKDSPLELAYALTVHKSQGSEFDLVIMVVPNPCFNLSREMLYTALTRQKSRIVVLYQGDRFQIKELSSPVHSDTLSRMTNLFRAPDMIEVNGKYLEKYLIHQATDDTLLRSKSELLIYQRLLDKLGDKGYDILYEQSLEFKEVQKLPDFTIENDDTGEVWYWEHLGMLHDPEYVERWEEKLAWYKENGILPHEEGGGPNGTLIISQDIPIEIDGELRGAISYKTIDEIISSNF
ncbi:MAG: AAA family ATPase [Bacteroidetes bacterium]|nr:AAA family ATPase [Bacteroidota bacterium]